MTVFLGSLFDGISKGAVYALVAVALVLVFRSTRVVNFAQAGQAVFTSYVGLTVFNRTDSYILAFVAAVLAGIIIGALVDWLVMRPVAAHAKGSASGVTQVIATLGLLGMFEALSGLIWGGEPRPYPTPVSTQGLEIAGTQVAFSLFNVFTVVTVVIVMIIFSILIQRTRLGLALRAAAFRPDIAALSGIRVNRMRLLGWALAGAAGGVAGVLITTPPNNLSPNALDLVLVFGFTAAVIGGLDSLIGAVVGGLVLGLGLSFIEAYVDGSLTFVAVFLVLLVTLLVRPRGLFGSAEVRRA
jgi:branched-chain amino acid transport system permease protein